MRTFHRSIPPVRCVRMLSLVAAFPPDRLEYGRAMSNNNAEGCGAVSGFASKKSLDI